MSSALSSAMASSPLWLPPLVRAVTTAVLVVGASHAAEVMGPLAGALIASLPVASGPAYVFLAMRHGAEFIAGTAVSGLAANAATGLMLIAYARLATRPGGWRGILLAALAWTAAALATRLAAHSVAFSLLLNLVVYGVGMALSRPLAPARVETRNARRPGWIDLALRAAAVGAFVTLVVAASTALGPSATGTATGFPVSTISLLALVRVRLGDAVAGRLAADALPPMLGYGFVLLTVHLAAVPLGAALALPLALAVSVSWSAAILALGRRRSSPPPGLARHPAQP